MLPRLVVIFVAVADDDMVVDVGGCCGDGWFWFYVAVGTDPGVKSEPIARQASELFGCPEEGIAAVN